MSSAHTLTRQRNPLGRQENTRLGGDDDDEAQRRPIKRAIEVSARSSSETKTGKLAHAKIRSHVRGRTHPLAQRHSWYEPSLSPERRVRRLNAQNWPFHEARKRDEDDKDDVFTFASMMSSPDRHYLEDTDIGSTDSARWDSSAFSLDDSQIWTPRPWQDGETPSSTGTSQQSTPTLTPATIATTEAVQDQQERAIPRSITPSLRNASAPAPTATSAGTTTIPRRRGQPQRRLHAICIRSMTGEWESVTAVFDESFPQSLLGRQTASVLGLQPQPLPVGKMQPVDTAAGAMYVDQAAYNVGVKSKMMGIPPMTVNILVVRWTLQEADVIVGRPLIEKLREMAVRVPLRSLGCNAAAPMDREKEHRCGQEFDAVAGEEPDVPSENHSLWIPPSPAAPTSQFQPFEFGPTPLSWSSSFASVGDDLFIKGFGPNAWDTESLGINASMTSLDAF